MFAADFAFNSTNTLVINKLSYCINHQFSLKFSLCCCQHKENLQRHPVVMKSIAEIQNLMPGCQKPACFITDFLNQVFSKKYQQKEINSHQFHQEWTSGFKCCCRNLHFDGCSFKTQLLIRLPVVCLNYVAELQCRQSRCRIASCNKSRVRKRQLFLTC